MRSPPSPHSLGGRGESEYDTFNFGRITRFYWIRDTRYAIEKEDAEISAIWTGLCARLYAVPIAVAVFFFPAPRFRFRRDAGRANGPPARATVIVQVYRDKPAPLHFRAPRAIVARAMNFMTDTCGEFVKRKEIMRRTRRDRVHGLHCPCSGERSIGQTRGNTFLSVRTTARKKIDTRFFLNTVRLCIYQTDSPY